jgi:hypothetical protein
VQATAALAHSNLAVSLLALGDIEEAKLHARSALELLQAVAGAAVSAKPTLYVKAALLICSGVRICSCNVHAACCLDCVFGHTARSSCCKQRGFATPQATAAVFKVM